MVVNKPIIKNSIDAASRASICIDLHCLKKNGETDHVGSGTGFVHRVSGKDFLITNWHVVTGRRPENPGELLDGYPDSPLFVSMNIPSKSNPRHFRPGEFMSLYPNGKPIWWEARFGASPSDPLIDLVAIPINFRKM